MHLTGGNVSGGTRQETALFPKFHWKAFSFEGVFESDLDRWLSTDLSTESGGFGWNLQERGLQFAIKQVSG